MDWDRERTRAVIEAVAQLFGRKTPTGRRTLVALALVGQSRADKWLQQFSWEGPAEEVAREVIMEGLTITGSSGPYAGLIAEETAHAAGDEAASRFLQESADLLQSQAPPSDADSLPKPEVDPVVNYRRSRIDAGASISLQQRFVPLALECPSEAGPQLQTVESLEEVLARTRPSATVVVVGEPGAGKSTLLRHLDLTLAQDDGLLPFFVELHRYRREKNQPLETWLAERWAKIAPNLPPMVDLLRQGQLCLLLDGLNEMDFGKNADDRFAALGEFFETCRGQNSRVVVTCRTRDMASGLGEIARTMVQPLDEDRIRTFVQRNAAKDAAPSLLNALRDDSIRTLYDNPYLLDLLVKQAGPEGQAPKNRADLFSAYLKHALQRDRERPTLRDRLDALLSDRDRDRLNQGQGQLPAPYAQGQGLLLPALGRLAFSLQESGPGQWPRLPVAKLSTELNLDEEQTRCIVKAGLSLQVLSEDLDEDKVYFAHQLWQEYFAARHWIHADADVSASDKAFAVNDARLGDLRSIIEGLSPGERMPERPATGWEETAIMAAAMAKDEGFVRALADRDLITAARAVLDRGVETTEAVKTDLRQKLASWMQHPQVELRARIDAGMILDDPIAYGFTEGTSPDGHRYLRSPVSRVPAGDYLIGSKNDDPDAYDYEKPQRSWTLAQDIWLARYPVTNAEYRCFMEADGYEDDRWWPEGSEARLWRDGEREDTETENWIRAVQEWSEARFQQLAKERGWTTKQQEALVEIRAMPLAEAVKKHAPKTHPGLLRRPNDWHDANRNRPLQPVVGVCLFEAEAYARWLSFALGQAATLPNESTWEAATRGTTGRTWAFGNTSSPLAANTLETRLRETAPIGVFLDGATPEKEPVFDLSGNIWEWTASATKNASQKMTSQIVRGGSWGYPSLLARGACRGAVPLVGRDVDQGFRVLFSSPFLKTDP